MEHKFLCEKCVLLRVNTNYGETYLGALLDKSFLDWQNKPCADTLEVFYDLAMNGKQYGVCPACRVRLDDYVIAMADETEKRLKR